MVALQLQMKQNVMLSFTRVVLYKKLPATACNMYMYISSQLLNNPLLQTGEEKKEAEISIVFIKFC